MSFDSLIPVLVLLTSLIAALVIFMLREERVRTRTTVNLAAAALKLILVGYMLWGVFHRREFETRIPLLPNLAEIPADIFNLFLAIGVVAGRCGDLMKAMHLVAFSLLTACCLSGTWSASR